MAERKWTPLMLLAQVNYYYRRFNCWPTIGDLARETQQTTTQVRELLDKLAERRFIKMDGDTVYPWEAGPSPVVTYRMSPEEIAAKYGPPGQTQAKPKQYIDLWPRQSDTAEEDDPEMPTGQRIDWPNDEELLALAHEIRTCGGSPAEELAERFGCSAVTVQHRLRRAWRRVRKQRLKESTSPETSAAGDAIPGETVTEETPEQTSEPTPGELMQEAEAAATAIADGALVEPEASSEAHNDISPDESSRLRRMLLVDPDAVRVTSDLDHVTRAPEKAGDHWAQPVRQKGYLRFREWVCVAVLADGSCLMVPPEAAATEQRRTA